MTTDMKIEASYASHGGTQHIVQHASRSTGTPMRFSIYLPPQAASTPCFAVIYLSGLTCSPMNVTEKGEFRRAAAERGLIVICPDTSPRGDDVADEPRYDLGQGAGFYLDATAEPWSRHFRMESYVARELPAILESGFPIRPGGFGIMGHSMGGHGALTLALKHPQLFRSCSAFSPIVAPTQVPWGQSAFAAYLGGDPAASRRCDAVALIEDGARVPDLLVDQGTADAFLSEQLRPDLLEEACRKADIPLTLRMQDGYDHSYYFISTFMADHVAWHAERLGRGRA